MVENLLTLLMLVMLQIVLGLDNLLYISLESQRVAKEKQKYVRTVGISVAIVLRIILLFVLIKVIGYFQEPVFSPHIEGVIEASFNIHSFIVLFGGIFIIYTATKEILHMMRLKESNAKNEKPASVNNAIFMIVIMNIVFSFDSILSAMALSDVLWVMSTAIVVGGVLMIFLAGKVSEFLQQNKMYEVLGLFILFVVGIMLLTEGAHIGHLELFGNEITAMSKTTFYFVISILIITDIVQSIYGKNLAKKG
ncbi:MAG: putative tellurium resistance membrane protein TerC [Flammeovirgaceae bacterium]|jgi:predicted tellurium resistance membrane protein TerC